MHIYIVNDSYRSVAIECIVNVGEEYVLTEAARCENGKIHSFGNLEYHVEKGDFFLRYTASRLIPPGYQYAGITGFVLSGFEPKILDT